MVEVGYNGKQMESRFGGRRDVWHERRQKALDLRYCPGFTRPELQLWDGDLGNETSFMGML